MLRRAHILMTAAVCLLTLGVLMTASAGVSVTRTVADPMAPLPGVTPWSAAASVVPARSVVFATLAIVVMFIAARVDVSGMFGLHPRTGAPTTRWYRTPLPWMLALALVCVALTFVPGLSRSVNGSSRWLHLPPASLGLSFQPSELMKWTMILGLSWWCARRSAAMRRFFTGLLPALLFLGVGAGLVLIEDLGTGALIGGVGLVLLLAGGARWWHIGALVPAGAAVVVAAIVTSPYRINRLLAFLDPWADPAGIGYHPIQSMLAFAQGGVTGAGLGHAVQKFYLPEDTTDFVFPILCEELGLAGGALTIGLYLVILWVGLGVVARCGDPFRRLVGLGVLTTLGMQAAINLAVVTVVVPTKGIALPLVSAGGTGWIMTAAMIGLLAALDEAAALEDGDEVARRWRRSDADQAVGLESPAGGPLLASS